MTKIHAEALKEESTLVVEFKKSKPLRAYSAEHGIANSIVIKKNKIHSKNIITQHMK